MSNKFARRALALTIGLTTMVGCATQTPIGKTEIPAAPVKQAKQALPAGWFTAPLAAPEGKTGAPTYTTQALPMYPHLLGPEYQASLSDATNGEAERAAKVFNTQDNTYMVVYERGMNDIWARITDDQGVLVIADFKVVDVGFEPRVAYIKHLNQFMVTYDTGDDVRAYRISTSGALIGGEIVVSNAAGDQKDPDIAYDPINKKVLIVWEDDRSGDNDIFTRLFMFNGNQTIAQTAETLAGNSAPDVNGNVKDQSDPRVAFSPDSQKYVVVFEDERDCGVNDQDIWGQALNYNGALVGGNYPVSQLNQRQGAPAIDYNPLTGFFLVAFEDESNGEADRDILGRALDAWGNPVYSEGVICNQYGKQEDPAVRFNTGSWTWLVVWEEELTHPDSIMGRHFGPYFEVGDKFSITPDGKGYNPDVAANPHKEEFNVVFDRPDNTVFGRRTDRGY